MIDLTLDQVINSYRNKTKTIRQQRCKQCWTSLAIQATDNVESESEGDFWLISGGVIVKGEFQPMYRRSGRWFGNPIRCPKCGLSGNLPGDKPLNWEQMEKEREAQRV